MHCNGEAVRSGGARQMGRGPCSGRRGVKLRTLMKWTQLVPCHMADREAAGGSSTADGAFCPNLRPQPRHPAPKTLDTPRTQTLKSNTPQRALRKPCIKGHVRVRARAPRRPWWSGPWRRGAAGGASCAQPWNPALKPWEPLGSRDSNKPPKPLETCRGIPWEARVYARAPRRPWWSGPWRRGAAAGACSAQPWNPAPKPWEAPWT